MKKLLFLFGLVFCGGLAFADVLPQPTTGSQVLKCWGRFYGDGISNESFKFENSFNFDSVPFSGFVVDRTPIKISISNVYSTSINLKIIMGAPHVFTEGLFSVKEGASLMLSGAEGVATVACGLRNP